jgi:predicted transposase/invertase (TIGR01784 family)
LFRIEIAEAVMLWQLFHRMCVHHKRLKEHKGRKSLVLRLNKPKIQACKGIPIERYCFCMSTSDIVHQPHDRFFKAVFGERQRALAWLPQMLPAVLADSLNWQKLQVLPGGMVDEQLKESHADLLFTIPSNGQEEVYVYCLFEHQSSIDWTMPLRLLRYMVRIWERHVQDKGERSLPLIIPLVLYQGAVLWTAPRRLRELLAVPGEWQWADPWIPDFSYTCVELATAEAQQVIRTADLKEVLSFMRAVTLPEVHEARLEAALIALGRLCQAHADSSGLKALMKLCLAYLLNQTSNVDKEQWRNKIMSIELPLIKESAMNLIEQFIQEGLEQGLEQGLEKGLEKGRLVGERLLLQRMLLHRFGCLTDEQLSRIENANGESIERWSAKLFEVDSAAELFRV